MTDALVFDLDGTLVDSRRDLATAVNRMRRELGRAGLTVPEVVSMIGDGARNLVRRALGGAPAEPLLERALAIFYRHYAEVCTNETRPFPGVDALLTELVVRYPLAVLTNKPERFAREIVAALGWRERFAILVGGDTLATRKPDPEGLRVIARHLELAASDLLLVGDSRIDAATADAGGCAVVLVEWGFADGRQRAELARHEWVADVEVLRRRLS